LYRLSVKLIAEYPFVNCHFKVCLVSDTLATNGQGFLLC